MLWPQGDQGLVAVRIHCHELSSMCIPLFLVLDIKTSLI